jgi:hypothetical protein
VERPGDPDEELNGHGRGREEEVEENVEKGGRSYCGRVLRWCNPHLLRGRIVIARGERETGA